MAVSLLYGLGLRLLVSSVDSVDDVRDLGDHCFSTQVIIEENLIDLIKCHQAGFCFIKCKAFSAIAVHHFAVLLFYLVDNAGLEPATTVL